MEGGKWWGGDCGTNATAVCVYKCVCVYVTYMRVTLLCWDDRLLSIQSFGVMFILMCDVSCKIIPANYTYKSVLIAHVWVTVMLMQCY